MVFSFLSAGDAVELALVLASWAPAVPVTMGRGGWLPPSIDWNYETLNCGCVIMAGGAPELPGSGIGCGGGDKYLFGLKPPMAAMSAMFVI